MCILLIQTYEICDALRYIANPVNGSSYNFAVPQNGSVSFKINHKTIASGGGGCFVQLVDSSHTYFVGNWASNGTNGLLIRNTGSSSNLVSLQPTATVQGNTEHYIEATWNNGTWTYTLDTETVTGNGNYTPTSLKTIEIRPSDGSYLIDLIIKPL